MDDGELDLLADELMQVMAGDAWWHLQSGVAQAPESRLTVLVLKLDRFKKALLDDDLDSARTAWTVVFREVRDLATSHPEALGELAEWVTTLRDYPEDLAAPDVAAPVREDVLRHSASGDTLHGSAIVTGAIIHAHFTGGDTPPGDTPPGDHRSDFRDGQFTGPVQGNGVQNNNYYGPGPHHALPAVAHWPRLDRADPVALGVRRTRRLSDEPVLPAYTERDCDAGLGALVRNAARSGGLVLVTGEPLSGKTRTAWAALFGNLSGETRIYAPSPGTDLRGLPAVLRGRGGENTVVWLDDLEGHLGEKGLTAAVLAELVQQSTPVIATMGDEAYDLHRFGASPSARLLIGVEPVELSCEWSPAELARLDGPLSDHRLSGARGERGDRGVTEYLAIGPELADQWRRAGRRTGAHPRGYLLVRAAIDLARCGARGEVALDVLRAAHRMYGPDDVRAERESFEDALAWATGIQHGVTGMLVPGRGENTWRAYGSLVADAEDQAQGFTSPVPLEMWLLALEAVRGVARFRTVVFERAHAVLERRAAGDPDVLMALGRIDREFGDEAAAERWFRGAADAGSTEAAGAMGRLLAARGDGAAAIPYLEMAARAGDVEAQGALGAALADRSVHWLTRAAEAGDGAAAHRLGELSTGVGDNHEARRWYVRAVEMGHEEAAGSLGSLFHEWHELEVAERWYRRALAHTTSGSMYYRAANSLALVLRERDPDDPEVESLYRAAAEAGSVSAATNLANDLRDRGETEEARRWFEVGHARGSYYAAAALAAMLWDQGAEAEAEEWFHKAAEAGHHEAEDILAELARNRPIAPDNVEG
ncbi:tetratricopeptide repeat protein [Streptomyces sp. NBC_01433]|uniref:tetratricopeptide repeat protein n=1 Tax=Streptomyces sp. NBC_01433 TaxID=2903864 RepID=UPI002258B29B|nr:tetratricopeptide repeat protein [Streptomyces sp. NBC_01433]MCX4676660.1 tetratricopeptide repeat protein [Streptomyces sp. NBC_01433]